MLEKFVLNTKRNVCVCTAHNDHLCVNNIYCFDALESTLLDTNNNLDGCEIILCNFNERIADWSCVMISFDEND